MTTTTTGTIRSRTRAGLAAAACLLALALLPGAPARAAFSDYGLESVGASLSTTQAGGHPDFTNSFSLTTDLSGHTFARTRDVVIDLPPGLIGNPNAIPACTEAQFKFFSCPPSTQVGIVELNIEDHGSATPEPLYNMKPTTDATVAQLGFIALVVPTHINVTVRSDGDYGVRSSIDGAAGDAALIGSIATLWARPADSSHDDERLTPLEALHECTAPCEGDGADGLRESDAPDLPFMTNPTRCGVPLEVGFFVRSYQLPEQPDAAAAPLGPIDGCESVPFDPSIDLQPTTNRADSPTGMDVSLEIPQPGLADPGQLATAHLKKTVVTLPEGLDFNPAAANGLGACNEAQIGLVDESPIRFDKSDPSCPEASKVGTAEIETPLLDDPLTGALYVADPSDNPFDTLLSGYLVARGKGVLVKLAGRFDPDPDSGRITATFDNNPQQPVSSVELHFKSGPHGVLITPRQCGEYEIETALSPWSAADPEHPTAAETATRTSSFEIAAGPAGSCPGADDFAPSFDAGTVEPLAGHYSALVVHLRREDGSQRFGAVTLDPPPGLLAKLAGAEVCSDAALAAAAARSGAAEKASPSCPPGSRLGSVVAAAGAGPSPYYAPGSVYLAGPYKGGPLSLAVVAPATAGPFDLGTVVSRVATYVDPRTARITAVSDPLPRILHGIPLDIRAVDVSLDRAEFTRNPTSCDPLALTGLLTSTLGRSAALESRFQVGECGRLGFRPRVSLRLFGKRLTRGNNPQLKAVIAPRAGDANISRIAVTMPHSLFLDQSHIRTVCTRVQFAADACPGGSIYGHVRAESPLVDYPLTGNVYLRSSDNPLPDLVADLRGPDYQPVRIEGVGRTDAVRGALRNTFDVVPDAPVSKIVLLLQAGRKSLLVASRNLCKGTQRARINLSAHNGRRLLARQRIEIPGCKKKRRAARRHHRRIAARGRD